MSVYLGGTFAIHTLSFPFVLCLRASCYLQLEGPSPSTGKARSSYPGEGVTQARDGGGSDEAGAMEAVSSGQLLNII